MNIGEIWQINLEPVVGQEIMKERPCLIVSNDFVGRNGLKTIVPLTRYQDKHSMFPWLIPIEVSPENGLRKKSSADAFQVRALSVDRFLEFRGHIDEHKMFLIHEAILKTFNPRYKISY